MGLEDLSAAFRARHHCLKEKLRVMAVTPGCQVDRTNQGLY
jgi:hypothetical protein